MSRDPIGEEGGLNLYGFVGNNGVSQWDYLGLDWVRDFFVKHPKFADTVYEKSHIFTGFGDEFTLGISAAIRKALGDDYYVHQNSKDYKCGVTVAVVVDTATGVKGLASAGYKQAGGTVVASIIDSGGQKLSATATRALEKELAEKVAKNIEKEAAKKANYPKDFATKKTKNWSSAVKSEGDARSFARTKLGSNPIEVEPNKWRSVDGKWQYRAKPGDVSDKHIHLEELNPDTGEVLQNLHLRW